jgi:hypothetical protein
MGKTLLRLGGVLLAFASTTSAAPPAFDGGSILIVQPDELLDHDRIDAIDPNDPNGGITEWAYDARFTVVDHLAGPDIGEKPRILFIDRRHWHDEKLLMIVHRDGRGRLWARHAWQEVGSELCLTAQQVAKLGLVAAFAAAHDNDEGQRCIDV